MYAAKFNSTEEYFTKKLWGDNYFDPTQKKWIKENIGSDGKELQRGFVQFIMEPIIKLINNIEKDNLEPVFKTVEKLGLTIDKTHREMKGKFLMKAIMSEWINAADSLLSMIITKLPSPVEA